METQQLKAKAKEEFKKMVFLTIYFFALFGTLTTYKRLLLAEHGMSFAEYGSSLVTALVLAKVILIGAALRVGSRFNQRPLVIPALYKTLCFSGLTLGLAVAERFGRGWWRGESTASVLAACAGPEKWGILARVATLFIALIPFFAFWETDRVIGRNVLYELFFRPRKPGDVQRLVAGDGCEDARSRER
jgi:hypothetical protein